MEKIQKILASLLLLAISLTLLTIIKILIYKLIDKIFDAKENKLAGKKQRLNHFRKLAKAGANLVYIIVVIIIILDYTGLNNVITALITFAGVGSLVVGLAAQDIFKDIIAGFLLITEDKLAFEDYVKINQYEGTIEEIHLRNIQLRTYSGQLITIPTGEIGTVINYSRGRARALCEINIPSKENIERVKNLIFLAGNKLKSDMEKVGITTLSSAIVDGIVAINDNNYRVRAYVMCDGGDFFSTQRQFNEYILSELKSENIDVVVASRVLIEANPSAI